MSGTFFRFAWQDSRGSTVEMHAFDHNVNRRPGVKVAEMARDRVGGGAGPGRAKDSVDTRHQSKKVRLGPHGESILPLVVVLFAGRRR